MPTAIRASLGQKSRPSLHNSALQCPDEWNYPPHTVEVATVRAEVVRRRLKELSKVYSNIALLTSRGFIAFLVEEDH